MFFSINIGVTYSNNFFYFIASRSSSFNIIANQYLYIRTLDSLLFHQSEKSRIEAVEYILRIYITLESSDYI